MNYKHYFTQKNLAILYAIFLLVSIGYIRSVVTADTVKVQNSKEKEEADEVKPVKVTLIVADGKSTKVYRTRLENDDSILDLINDVRKNQGLNYEKTAYTYGTEIITVNGISSDQHTIWNAYEADKKVTFDIETIDLSDEQTYYLKLENR